MNKKLANCLSRFPENGLDHWPFKTDGKRFNIDDSEVVKWLIDQPEMREYLFSRMAHLELIEFDHTTKRWKAVAQIQATVTKLEKNGVFHIKRTPHRKALLTFLTHGEQVSGDWLKWAREKYGIRIRTFYRMKKKLIDEARVERVKQNIYRRKGEVEPTEHKLEPRSEPEPEPLICKACECKMDANGCGCNPHDA